MTLIDISFRFKCVSVCLPTRNFIKKGIMGEYMRTGVQFAINMAVFKLLKMNSVYPVANEKTLSDKKGRILPDLILHIFFRYFILFSWNIEDK